ncbi:hypothetical protein BDY19DRAFT_981056 [Irpex rosettiformis]|uniref:Uncharacterized protein n=1 Tax=Irpex rosettiformis TaxID=378272 RepID=A0ACB8TM66_9APHY|nr:hypothetical protein BDY19DRAFT_981056 [Irpex rosettiformis]
MAPVTNPRLLFTQIPTGLPNAEAVFTYDNLATIDLEADLHGGLLVKILCLSLDPYMRNRMRSADTEGDMPAFPLGEVVTGFGVGVILRSESAEFPAGQHVGGFMPYQHFAIFGNAKSSAVDMPALGLTVLENPHGLPWRLFVGNLGMTGQTAYYALKDVSEAKPGETIFISAAAGAVGLLLVQLACAKGMKVIASCGSNDKADLLRSLGAAHVINRRTDDINAELRKVGPIDIYIDHVGGQALEAAIENAAMNARIVICGAISTYNGVSRDNAYGVRNLWLVNRYRITIRALVVIDWHGRYLEEFWRVMPSEIATGNIKCFEHVCYGLGEAGRGFVDMMEGRSVGKAVIVLSEE